MCKKWKWSNHQTKFVDFGHYQDWLNIFLRKVKVKSTKFNKLCTLSRFLTIFLDGQWKWNYYEMPKVRIFVPDANLEWQCQIILPSGQIEIRLFIADACSCSNMGWCVDFLYKQLTYSWKICIHLRGPHSKLRFWDIIPKGGEVPFGPKYLIHIMMT